MDEVNVRVREKKRMYHAFLDNKLTDSWLNQTKRAARKTVVVAEAAHYADVREKLDKKEDERLVYLLANS
ncbi:hypothetical protein Y032_0154g2985 [Ancylostoma ceylanicum]|uniref:Uncharacterized protein n=1 Tax=Ancylostoma ceylanicum TaxID=53326 RepID=A0A016T000_9BILA|nr:hypothetical protein Y032_0154g2985 [Ancylostoma ceylanicum]